MLGSFYGGKQGRSYHIVARYDSIYDMVTAFQKGPSNTDVAFDEYVIIDTILHNNNKSDIENGIIYRRGYNYSEAFSGRADPETHKVNRERTVQLTVNGAEINTWYQYVQGGSNSYGTSYIATITAPDFYDFKYRFTSANTVEIDETTYELNLDVWNETWNDYVLNPGGGAIYVGQIVGPEGGAAAVQLLDWDIFLEKSEEAQQEKIKGKFFVTPYPGYDPAHIGPHGSSGYDDEGYDEEGYLDIFQYGYCTIRDEQGNVIGTYLSFSFPYVVFNFEAHGISAYPASGTAEDYTDPITGVTYHFNPDTRLWEYDELIRETESNDHKYYKHYEIQVPKGVHGQNVYELEVRHQYNADSYADIYNADGSYRDDALEHNPDGSVKYDASGNPVLKPTLTHQILTYKTENYDALQDGEISEIIPVSPYKIVTSVENDNKVTPPVSNPNYEHNYPKEIKWHYTYGEDTRVDYSIIERVWVQNGDTTDPVYVEEGKPNHLTDSHLYVLYSTEARPRDLGLIKFVTSIWVQKINDPTRRDQDDNILTANCVYIQLAGEERPRYLGLIKKLEDIWIQADADDKHPSSRAINPEGDTVKKDYIYSQLTNEEYPHELGFIRKIISIEKPQGSRDLYVNYNYDAVGGDPVPEKIPVVEIEKVTFDGDLFLMRYKDIDGHEAEYNQTYPYNGELWINLGSVVKGNHILTNFATIEELEEEYPNGFGTDAATANRAGWLATIGNDQDGYSLYGFDYFYRDTTHPNGRWYNVQDMSAVAVRPEYTVLLSYASDNPDLPANPAAAQLNVGGLWFVEIDQ